MEENLIYEALYDVVDPEIGVNIIDLGLVYEVKSNPHNIELLLTLTSPACPLQDDLETQIVTVLQDFRKPVKMVWTFKPLWSPAFMSDDGKEQMIALGAHIPVYN